MIMCNAEERMAIDKYCVGLLNEKTEVYQRNNSPVSQVGFYFRKEQLRSGSTQENALSLEIEVLELWLYFAGAGNQSVFIAFQFLRMKSTKGKQPST